MAVDTLMIQRIVGTGGFYGLKAIIAIVRAIQPETQRPDPTPGREYVPSSPKEKDPELS